MPPKSPSKAMPAVKQMPDAALEMIAHRFRALSEPVRLKILSVLMGGEKNVSQLVELTGTGQANVSKHLSVLKEAAMITTKKEGLATMCSISDPAIFQLCEIMCARLKDEHEERSKRLRGI